MLADLRFETHANGDLIISLSEPDDITTHRLTIQNWMTAEHQIEEFVFADGLILTPDHIATLLQAPIGLSTDGDDNITGTSANEWVTAGDGNDIIFGQQGHDTIEGEYFNNTSNNTGGDDILYGGNGDDILYGHAGDDILSGGNGADQLNGGGGDDTLNGGDGNDTYVYRSGDGMDTITETGGTDVLKLENVTSLDALTFAMSGADLVIGFSDESTDEIRISNWSNSSRQIEQLQLTNGTTYSLGALTAFYEGTESSDTHTGTSNAEWLDGGAGDDQLIAGGGADYIIGGLGDDSLNGGGGGDTYIYCLGDGADTIIEDGGTDTLVFGEEIASIDNLVLDMDGSDLVISFKDIEGADLSTDQIRISSWTISSRRVEQLQFANGEVHDISTLSVAFMGTASDDSHTGTGNVDWLVGLDGDDTLSGAGGADYLFGDAGSDTLSGGNGADTLSGGEGDDILSGDDGNDRVIGGAGDDSLSGGADDDMIMAGSGDDTLDGGAGDDILMGNSGNDTITASAGADYILFGYGDDQDTYIGSTDSAIQGTDSIIFGEGVTRERVWFAQDGDDLIVRLLGSDDSMTFENWFDAGTSTPSAYVEEFIIDDETLSYSDVNQLVSAMATFTTHDGYALGTIQPDNLPPTIQLAMHTTWQIS